ncbi:MAG TPA: SLBB domain-containing protein [Acidobacteriota bacterium]|nr:SLBB domain-containing protein [Acidobacteriota bacterium]
MILAAALLTTVVPVSAQSEGNPTSPEPVIHEPSPAVTTMAQAPAYLDGVIDPDAYLVGPGDRLSVNIWGEQPQQFPVTITPEASVIIPTVGEVSVRGLTLTAVKAVVARRLQELYPDAAPSVTLTEVRRFRVTVTGAVNSPGLHVVTANTRAAEALRLAGLRERACRRGIRLERAGTDLFVDLDQYERLGRRSANPYLAEGDVLHVPTQTDWESIDISGAVNAAGRFDHVPGDRVGDLLDLAFGLSPDADTSRLELWRFDPGSDSAHQVAWPAGSSYSAWRQVTLVPDDRLIVRAQRGYRPRQAVTLTGEVVRPGRDVLVGDSIFLRDVIDSAGGFTLEADLRHSYIQRGGTAFRLAESRNRIDLIPDELRTRAENDLILADALSVDGRVVTDFVALFERGDEDFNVALIDGDLVFVPRYTASVNVIGRVVQPGLVAFRPGASLGYYLQRAGGYAWQADRGGTFLIKGSTGAAVKRRRVGSITAGDTIVIPTRRAKNWWRAVRETMVVLSSLATVYLVVDQATQ